MNEFEKCISKIEKYKRGFKFTIDYSQIPYRYHTGLKKVLREACKMGLLEQIETGLNLDLEITDETFIRL